MKFWIVLSLAAAVSCSVMASKGGFESQPQPQTQVADTR